MSRALRFFIIIVGNVIPLLHSGLVHVEISIIYIRLDKMKPQH